MDTNKWFEQLPLRRWWLLSKALESTSLVEALRLARSAEDFLCAPSSIDVSALGSPHQPVAIKASQTDGAPAALRCRLEHARISSEPIVVLNDDGTPRESEAAALDAVDSMPEASPSTEVIDPSLRLSQVAEGTQSASEDSRRLLTPRESEILLHLVHGESNKMIARQLGITEATVKVHLKSLLRKIGVTNRTQAAIWAVNYQHGQEGRI